jgi:hypothetical protein
VLRLGLRGFQFFFRQRSSVSNVDPLGSLAFCLPLEVKENRPILNIQILLASSEPGDWIQNRPRGN